VHDISLITTIALGLSAALFFGLLAKRFGLSPIVGYLLAGIAIGPNTPGFTADVKIAGQLAEIGVILLMFGVGLHFHLKDLLAVRGIAIPGALGQSTAATLACMGIAIAAGWTWKAGVVLGIAVSVASTVVLLRSLLDHGMLDTPEGHAAVGWLVVEDIITVLVLVVLPPLAATNTAETGLWKPIGFAVLNLALLTAIILLAGARFIPWLLLRVARLRSRELFTLSVLVMSICIATLAYVAFGASMALGAFLAGMVVGQSKVSEQAGTDLLPMRDAFAVLFFVAVGMLFDYRVMFESPGLVIGVLAIILVVKPVAALVISVITGHSLKTGLTVAGGLAQVGEFSFIVGELAKTLGLMPGSGHNLLVAGAIISISLNPFLFRHFLSLEPKLMRWQWLARMINRRNCSRGDKANDAAAQYERSPGTVRAIVVGYGPVGQTVTRLLREFGIDPTIVESNIDTVLELQGAARHAVYGDASRREILVAAGVLDARYLIVTVPKVEVALAVIQRTRELAPNVCILTRASYLNQQQQLEQAGAAVIRYDEAESATALAEALLQEIKVPGEQVDAVITTVRSELEPNDDRKIVV
jgi:CPA2 family monovalent cation:H+ antiporter-2